MERKVGQNRQPSSVFESILYRYLLWVLFPIQTRQWAVVFLFWELRTASEKTGELEERVVCLRFRRRSLPLCRSPLTLALDWFKVTNKNKTLLAVHIQTPSIIYHRFRPPLVKPRSTHWLLWWWGIKGSWAAKDGFTSLPFSTRSVSLVRTRELFKATTMKRATATKTSLKSEVTLFQALSGLFLYRSFRQTLPIYFWSWVLKDCIKVQEKKKKVVVLCSLPPQNVKLGIFTS